jgi:transcription termination/antitermination protein NusG
MSWYVINVTPGFEQKIKNTIETSHSFKKIKKRILVPVIQKKGFVNGKIHFYLEKLYPGYVFVECEKEDYHELFSYLSNLAGILNMSSLKSVHRISHPIEEFEMLQILKLMNGNLGVPQSDKSGKTFTVNDRVKITSGPFSNFEGVIKEVSNSTIGETKIKVCTRLFNNDLTFIIVSEFQIDLMSTTHD